MENKNRDRGASLEGLEGLLKEKIKEMIKEVLEEVAHEEREMFFEEKRNKDKRNKTAALSNGATMPEMSKAEEASAEEGYMLRERDKCDEIVNKTPADTLRTEQTPDDRFNYSCSDKVHLDKANRKNGFYSRNLLTHIGEVNLNIPRDRYDKFHIFFIDRYNRSLFTISEIVISMYQGMLSTKGSSRDWAGFIITGDAWWRC